MFLSILFDQVPTDPYALKDGYTQHGKLEIRSTELGTLITHKSGPIHITLEPITEEYVIYDLQYLMAKVARWWERRGRDDVSKGLQFLFENVTEYHPGRHTLTGLRIKLDWSDRTEAPGDPGCRIKILTIDLNIGPNHQFEIDWNVNTPTQVLREQFISALSL